MKKLIFLFFITITINFAQTSEWYQTFSTASGPVTTGTFEIVPYNNTYPTGAITMTHLGSGSYKVLAPIGTYKLYYNGSAVTNYSKIWIGEEILTTISSWVLSLQEKAHLGSNYLELRDSMVAQTFRVFNYDTTGKSEYGVLGWSSNILQFGTSFSGTGNTRSISFIIGGSPKWAFGTTGIFSANSDNTLDIGYSESGRPRSIYVGTSINSPATYTNTINLKGISITQNSDSATVTQSNGTKAQGYRIYNTISGGNSEYSILSWISNSFWVGTTFSGTGSGRALILATSGSPRWNIGATTGHLNAQIDNIYDVGATSSGRPRNIYLGTSIKGGSGTASRPTFTFNSEDSVGIYLATGTTGLEAMGFGYRGIKLMTIDQVDGVTIYDDQASTAGGTLQISSPGNYSSFNLSNIGTGVSGEDQLILHVGDERVFTVYDNQNISWGKGASWGSNAERVISYYNLEVVAPTTQPANFTQMWVTDYNIDDTRFWFWGEQGDKMILGNNTLTGSDQASGNLILESTKHATKGNVFSIGNFYPGTNNTYYLGKYDDDTPYAWKGAVFSDQMTGTIYALTIINGTVSLTNLTD